MVRDRLPRDRTPLRAGAGQARQAAEIGHPHHLFRTDGPHYYNSWRWLMPTARSSASIARATFPMAPAIRRNTISGPATPASRHGRRGRHDRRRHLLGSMVPGSGARHGAGGGGNPVLPHRHRLRASRPDARHPPAMAARDAGPRGRQRRAVVAANRIGVEENDGASRVLRPFLHRRPQGELVASSATRTKACWSQSFDLDEIARYRAEWGFFRDRRTDLYVRAKK